MRQSVGLQARVGDVLRADERVLQVEERRLRSQSQAREVALLEERGVLEENDQREPPERQHVQSQALVLLERQAVCGAEARLRGGVGLRAAGVERAGLAQDFHVGDGQENARELHLHLAVLVEARSGVVRFATGLRGGRRRGGGRVGGVRTTTETDGPEDELCEMWGELRAEDSAVEEKTSGQVGREIDGRGGRSISFGLVDGVILFSVMRWIGIRLGIVVELVIMLIVVVDQQLGVMRR